jgi:hypothetical protein
MFPSPGWDSVPAAPILIYLSRVRLCAQSLNRIPYGSFSPRPRVVICPHFRPKSDRTSRHRAPKTSALYEIKNLPPGVESGPKLALGNASGEGASVAEIPDETHSGRGVVHPLVGAPSPLTALPNQP